MFKKIEGYDNYSISLEGEVRNDKTNKFLKPVLHDGYYRIVLCKNGKPKAHSLHRLIAIAFIQKEEGRDCVDHIDNNRTNNSLENLRWCSKKENNQNRSLSNKNTSGVKGVHFEKKSQKWRVQINIDGKQIRLGYFKTLEEATLVRREKAQEIFGLFTNACEA
tara:strand:- start:294 stop:782 length:489 start_codon:yes stop_codon:yes gene_type:complete